MLTHTLFSQWNENILEQKEGASDLQSLKNLGCWAWSREDSGVACGLPIREVGQTHSVWPAPGTRPDGRRPGAWDLSSEQGRTALLAEKPEKELVPPGRVSAASILVRSWQLVKLTVSSRLEGRLKRTVKINVGPRVRKICEERRNSASPGHCHSNARGAKDAGEDSPREKKEKKSYLRKGER